jgi:uncharacterized membrane protein
MGVVTVSWQRSREDHATAITCWAEYREVMMRFLGGAALALISVLGSSSGALADFRVCNQSPIKISVAFGWNDPADGWSSKGWFNLAPSGCHTMVEGPLTSRVYYVYAKGPGGWFWGPKDSSEPGGTFCIDPKLKYTTHNRDYRAGKDLIDCKAVGLVGTRFTRVDTAGSGDYTYGLRIDDDPMPPPVVTPPGPSPKPGPAPVAIPGPSPKPGPAPVGTACQRYPNLC